MLQVKKIKKWRLVRNPFFFFFFLAAILLLVCFRAGVVVRGFN